MKATRLIARWVGRITGRLVLVLAVLLSGPLLMLGTGGGQGADWRSANRGSAGIAPDPATTPEAVVQVYAARTVSWRGAFGVHTWISVKPENAEHYTIYHTLGWRSRYGGNGLVINRDIPDRYWFGAKPDLLVDLRGEGVGRVIDKIDAAARSYPYAREYGLWPGPNSNTFIGHVARAVPELRLDLPPTAIGKDYLGHTTFFDSAPSGTGYQLSLFGLASILVAVEEGIEINIAGLTLGIDPLDFNLKLPGIGRVGPTPDPTRTLE